MLTKCLGHENWEIFLGSRQKVFVDPWSKQRIYFAYEADILISMKTNLLQSSNFKKWYRKNMIEKTKTLPFSNIFCQKFIINWTNTCHIPCHATGNPAATDDRLSLVGVLPTTKSTFSQRKMSEISPSVRFLETATRETLNWVACFKRPQKVMSPFVSRRSG